MHFVVSVTIKWHYSVLKFYKLIQAFKRHLAVSNAMEFLHELGLHLEYFDYSK